MATDMFDGSSMPVAVRGASPAYQRGVELALREAGLSVERPPDVARWAALDGPRAVVSLCASPEDLERLAQLRGSRSDVVLVAILDAPVPADFRDALALGVSGLIERDAPLEGIVDAVHTAAAQRTSMPTDVARALARGTVPAADGKVSRREAEWLRQLANGATTRELARAVGYSERAMHRHLHGLYRRLGARTRTGALLQAVRRGVIE
jgi:DNA-binding NarL/FixJ family response regulator